MIRDVSQTLGAILDDPGLTTDFPELTAARIVFDRPMETFSPPQTSVDLFLYDIREDVEVRSNEPTFERRNGQVFTHRPPLRVACSYLVTAWPVGGSELPLQEHRLLGQVLQVLSRFPTIPHPRIPVALLPARIRTQDPPMPMTIAQADGLKNLSEFWSALGSKLRPSLTVTVTVGLDLFVPEGAPIVITERVRLEQRDLAATREELVRIGGQVTDAGNASVPGATVTLVEPGLTAATDAAGRYRLGMVAPGAYTLRVRSGASVREVSITVPAAAGSDYNVQLT
jgi:hypothetical protein